MSFVSTEIAVDFDGVLHYDLLAGLRGPRVIAGKGSVPGVLQWLAEAASVYKVHILSWRSRYWCGRYAMRRWLTRQLIAQAGSCWESAPEWIRELVAKTAFADPWEDEVRLASRRFVDNLVWPKRRVVEPGVPRVTAESVFLYGLPQLRRAVP